MERDIVRRLKEYFEYSPFPVAVAYLFGSRARGQDAPFSDTDIAVYLAEPDAHRRVGAYLPLLNDLRQIIGNSEVDLAYLNDVSPALAYDAVTGTLLFSRDERQRVALEATTLNRYFDHQEQYRARHRLLWKRVLAGKMGEKNADMIEKRIISERLDYIDAMLRRLKGYTDLSLEAFTADDATYHAALYELQTALEAITDIGNHIIAAVGLRKPEERGEIMSILAEEGIIAPALAERLTQAIGLRNAIVHGYLRLIQQVIYQTIRQDLGDVEEFCQAIAQYVDRETADSGDMHD